jgi:leucyl-tRNA synthetase
MPKYNPATIEPKWQKFWEEHRTFATPRLPEGEKLYVLDMFPYPSGDGLHVGHPEGQTATDIVCRYQRMRGKCVMHPMGWDAFGLPAEQYAKKTGTPPRITTEKNIGTFRRQEKMLGFSYDWDRELATTDVGYFRWTQWIFLQLHDTWYDEAKHRGRPIAELPIPSDVTAAGQQAVRRYQDEHRLAYQLEAPVNWCPALGTVLANEEVIGGLSERGSHPVVRIPLRQWMLRITAYADRLESDLDGLDWSEGIKALQRNWIGRSTGAEVDFFVGSGAPRTADDFKHWQQSRAAGGYPRKPTDDVLRIYTTRPDTLFGATYMVLAPEHPYVERLTTPEQSAAVKAYCERAARKSDLDRTDLAKEKTGVFTGATAVNPVNGQDVPIWVADYVLMGYGTGAIMAVPAHDTRDFEFAVQFGLPRKCVVQPGGLSGRLSSADAELNRWYEEVKQGERCFTEVADVDDRIPIAVFGHNMFMRGPTTAINSGAYDGLPTDEFKQRITADLGQQGVGKGAVNYKLRDWLFSRQHFWGEPFPILHELDEQGNPTGLTRVVPAEELPVDLPDMPNFQAHDTPEPPLEQAPRDWLYPVIDGVRYKRETNTMPQWAGSCWYYLRFLDPKNDQAFIDPQIEREWMPVDLYVGGAEHAVLHLLYSRFWHKVLYDRGPVTTREPFQRLVNQGMILGEVEFTGYRRADGGWVSGQHVKQDAAGQPIDAAGGQPLKAVKVNPADAKKQGEFFVLAADPAIRLESRAYKMSKSRGNVVNPDKVVAEYGADALRLYEMFMGPLEAVKPWSMEGVNGVRGFLDRAWRMIINDRAEAIELNAAVRDDAPTPEQARVLHRTIKGVTDDIDRMAFNTAIAKMMEFTNYFTKADIRPRQAMEAFVLLLSPFAPHMAEELWEALGREDSPHAATLAYHAWPTYDEAAIKEDTVEIPIQINGKLRGRLSVPADLAAPALEAAARADDKIAALLAGKTVVKAVVVPGRMVNFVVQG